MGTTASQRVQRYRDGLRALGLRPVQIWVPDVRRPGFDVECRRQSRLAAKADSRCAGLSALMDAAPADVDGWRE